MPEQLITHIEEVTPAWLTIVLTHSAALIHGAVESCEVSQGRGNWSTNARLTLHYLPGSQGAMPLRLFLKLVNANFEGGSFSPSEVTYYTRDYVGLQGAPLVRCYDAIFSGEKMCYHVLMDDLSETHVEAEQKAPTLEYGMALADGLAILHARWWGASRFSELGERMHSAKKIQRFVDISECGVAVILDRYANTLEPHWPAVLRTLFEKYPRVILERARDDNGFTVIHGDVGQKNILVPRDADRPIYIIDRQPFDWSLTIWLGVYDLAYAIVLDWDVEARRLWEIPILRRYHDQLIRNGVTGYTWEQLLDDYRLCAVMCVFTAAEYFRDIGNGQWVHVWLSMLRRSLTACDDLNCGELG
jgi:hypothetical protein